MRPSYPYNARCGHVTRRYGIIRAMLTSLRNEGYQVRLPVFEGPLDLLLHLIEREKLDISTISLTQVTDQFLDYVKSIEEVQPATLADFLVMAARLVYIKSRLLVPQPKAAGETDEEDPSEALARQLREYKRFRDAAKALQTLEESGARCYLRLAGPPPLQRRLERGEVTLADLIAAAHVAFAFRAPATPVSSVVTPLVITIHDQIRLIAQRTTGNRPVLFRSLLQHRNQRVEISVTLLAVLELIKRRQLTAEQSVLFGEIVIRPVEGIAITVNGTNGAEE